MPSNHHNQHAVFRQRQLSRIFLILVLRHQQPVRRENERLNAVVHMLTSTPAQRGSAFQPAQRSPPRKPGMHVLRKHRTASTEPMVTPSPSFAHTRKIRPTTMARKPHSTCAEGVQRPEDPDLPLYGNPPADMSQPREQMQSRLQDRNPLHPTPAPSAGTPDSAFLDLASNAKHVTVLDAY